MATRGISQGKWNAPGGKIEQNESPEECAKREVMEETGLSVTNLFHHGTINFFMEGKTALHTKVHLYSTRSFKGRIRSTEEGEVRWFPQGHLPVEMWEDDRYWLPLLLLGSRFNAFFYYDNENKGVVKYRIVSL